MPLAPGSRLGPYEIVAPVGAGGMGEVYRARDPRLDRTVAIKVLPSEAAPSAESRQRFEREAKTISQLSHPHICAIYDVGRDGDVEYLVMEFLEGETLLTRLTHGALPLEQTLRYGIQIADALDKAHRQGIVHRDLKPANVMITKTGVKLLDFGLAKAMAPPETKGSLTALPTQQALTQEGTILGTFQYMSPEQLEGKEADGRSDIFAFGALLYEMATGRKAFGGSSQASLISSIMKEDPAPISSVQPMSPPALDRLVRICLAKDAEDRWQSAHDVGSELQWINEGSAASGASAIVARRGRSRERMAWGLAAAVAAIAAALAIGYVRRAPKTPPLVRASLVLPEKQGVGEFAVSPDGRRIALVLQKDIGPPALWIRDLDAESAVPIAGTEGASFPFWSPDSHSIGFFVDGKLEKFEVGGGAPLVICDAPEGVGGSWSRDGVIVFAPSATSPLLRVSASGGPPEAVTKLDASRKESAHRYPFFLPDGRHFLYTSTNLGAPSGDPGNAIHVGSVDGRENKTLVGVVSNAEFAAGRVLYGRDGALVAQVLDLDRLATVGDPVVVAAHLVNVTPWANFFAYAASDSAVVVVPPFSAPSRLVWFDRSGRELGTVGAPDEYGTARISPDGRKVAVSIFQPLKQTSDIWIFDAVSGKGSKLVFGPYYNVFPTWSPDGKRILFASDRRARTQRPDLWVKELDGPPERLLLDAMDSMLPSDWSRDGRWLAVSKVPFRGRRKMEMWLVDASDPKQQRVVAAENANEGSGALSPDGRWLAYISDETGAFEVFVREVSAPGGKWKISATGGGSPRWRADGKELFFSDSTGSIMAMPVTVDSGFHAGEPVKLFDAHCDIGSDDPFGLATCFDVTADGQKLLVNVEPQSKGSPPMSLLLNWTALLKPPPSR